jgi:phosphatidylserine/phosphatidylglycerophosphate/cardiolipin synthase-like enzyme
MRTQAYFDEIEFHILHELRKAITSIHIAVAWFTDPDIFEHLCQKAMEGVRVELIVIKDEINRSSGLEYKRLADLCGLFLMVEDKRKKSAIMHNKFCVIDGVTVIIGSYNWSRKSRTIPIWPASFCWSSRRLLNRTSAAVKKISTNKKLPAALRLCATQWS